MKQDRKRREEWEILVNDFISSGEKQKSYCLQKGISYHAFRFWYYKLLAEKNTDYLCTTKATIDKSDFINLKIVTGDKKALDKTNCDNANKASTKHKTKSEVTGITEITGATITLANGIKVEITTSDILQLIVALSDVA